LSDKNNRAFAGLSHHFISDGICITIAGLQVSCLLKSLMKPGGSFI